MFLRAVPAIFAKSSELKRNALTTSFVMSFMWNVPVDSKADPIITLVGDAARKSILIFPGSDSRAESKFRVFLGPT